MPTTPLTFFVEPGRLPAPGNNHMQGSGVQIFSKIRQSSFGLVLLLGQEQAMALLLIMKCLEAVHLYFPSLKHECSLSRLLQLWTLYMPSLLRNEFHLKMSGQHLEQDENSTYGGGT